MQNHNLINRFRLELFVVVRWELPGATIARFVQKKEVRLIRKCAEAEVQG